jgi:hypothetical protein
MQLRCKNPDQGSSILLASSLTSLDRDTIGDDG